MRNTLLCRIRQFAKRQDIFFRKLEREGHDIYWLKAGREPDPCGLLEQFLKDEPLPPPALLRHQLRQEITAPRSVSRKKGATPQLTAGIASRPGKRNISLLNSIPDAPPKGKSGKKAKKSGERDGARTRNIHRDRVVL